MAPSARTTLPEMAPSTGTNNNTPQPSLHLTESTKSRRSSFTSELSLLGRYVMEEASDKFGRLLTLRLYRRNRRLQYV